MATSSIPKTQHAAVREVPGPSSKTIINEIAVPQPGRDQIVVKIKWTGLCGSDKALLFDEWKDYGIHMKPQSQGISGHEGAGIVTAVGNGMQDHWKVGDRAGIKWIASTLRQLRLLFQWRRRGSLSQPAQ